jgi:hypothetical protein
MSRTLKAAFIAALASLSLAIAHAADGNGSADGASPNATANGASSAGTTSNTSDPSTNNTGVVSDKPTSWSKEDANRNGVSDTKFRSADTDGDGRLDQRELEAAKIQKKQ